MIGLNSFNLNKLNFAQLLLNLLNYRLKAVIPANKSKNWFNALIKFEINILLSLEPELQVVGTPIVIQQRKLRQNPTKT